MVTVWSVWDWTSTPPSMFSCNTMRGGRFGKACARSITSKGWTLGDLCHVVRANH